MSKKQHNVSKQQCARVQILMTGVQAKTLVQERALAQELRKLAKEATTRAQEAETLANIVEVKT